MKSSSGFVFVFILICCPVYLAYAQADKGLTVSQDEPETTVPPGEKIYTTEEFDALPDEEKINVYFNFPWLLPEGFSPQPYMDLFHPDSRSSKQEDL